jgi:hypothetical protein
MCGTLGTSDRGWGRDNACLADEVKDWTSIIERAFLGDHFADLLAF